MEEPRELLDLLHGVAAALEDEISTPFFSRAISLYIADAKGDQSWESWQKKCNEQIASLMGPLCPDGQDLEDWLPRLPDPQ